MSDSKTPVTLGKTWKNINADAGIAVGTGIYVQNIGSGIVTYALSETEPTTQIGGQADENEQFKVTAGSSTLWAKCSEAVGKIAVQEV
jgi:hypothetical protein